MPTTTFDPAEGLTPEQQQAEAIALAQGEMLYEAEQADRSARMDAASRETEDVQLLAGKFKSQEDLIKAYKELESKLGNKTPDDEEEASEAQPEAPEVESEEEAVEAPSDVAFARALTEYEQGGAVSDEAIEALASMDPKELIKNYIKFNAKTSQERSVAATDVQQIQAIAGGPEAYSEMVQWAYTNLPKADQEAFNSVTNSGDVVAIRFAVEALHGRYRKSEGHEAPLVSGKKGTSSGPKGYRSQAELARDIGNPKYDKDPAFRADVMNRLAVSGDLL